MFCQNFVNFGKTTVVFVGAAKIVSKYRIAAFLVAALRYIDISKFRHFDTKLGGDKLNFSKIPCSITGFLLFPEG